MRFFLLKPPEKFAGFASFSHVGTWTDGKICDACGQGTSRLTEPLLIEWDPGSDRIGDFSWCGYSFVVPPGVVTYFEQNSLACSFGRTQVIKPTEKTKLPRVPYPYQGVRLSWAIGESMVNMDVDRSGTQLDSDCAQCGQRHYTFVRQGIVVPISEWHGQAVFLLKQFEKSGAMFVTEDTLQGLISAGFTNIGYMHAGTIE